MKLLLDQGLPRQTARLLREGGMDAVHVGEIGYSTAEDVAILQKAREDKRIVVTYDADFHALLALSSALGPSVIRMRIEGLRAEEVSLLIRSVIASCRDDLNSGAAVTVQPGRIRPRRLPLL